MKIMMAMNKYSWRFDQMARCYVREGQYAICLTVERSFLIPLFTVLFTIEWQSKCNAIQRHT